MMETVFIPGLELSRQFYWEIIRPFMDTHFSAVPHSAALLGDGSEVLGFDTAMSRDHDWGPRVQLFLEESDFLSRSSTLEGALRKYLPDQFHEFPVQWTINGPSNYRCVEIYTIPDFFLKHLNFDIGGEIESADWLTFAEQKLRTLTGGTIFWDGIGLAAIRERFSYYPHDIWLYLLACGWTRIGQEEHLMGRAGSAGDEIGSALIAARLVRDIMRLCFLMEKKYAPYAKWFGTAFAQLAIAKDLSPLLQNVLSATTWQERQKYLCMAYEIAATKHNQLGITELLDTKISLFFDRPFLVIDGGRFAQAIVGQLTDPAVKKLTGNRLTGSMDQFSDSTDLVGNLELRSVLKQLYE